MHRALQGSRPRCTDGIAESHFSLFSPQLEIRGLTNLLKKLGPERILTDCFLTKRTKFLNNIICLGTFRDFKQKFFMEMLILENSFLQENPPGEV